MNKDKWWEDNVFWKVIFRNLTPETQQFIQDDVSKRLAKQRRRICERLAGMKGDHIKANVNIRHEKNESYCCLECEDDRIWNAALDEAVKIVNTEI